MRINSPYKYMVNEARRIGFGKSTADAPRCTADRTITKDEIRELLVHVVEGGRTYAGPPVPVLRRAEYLGIDRRMLQFVMAGAREFSDGLTTRIAAVLSQILEGKLTFEKDGRRYQPVDCEPYEVRSVPPTQPVVDVVMTAEGPRLRMRALRPLGWQKTRS